MTTTTTPPEVSELSARVAELDRVDDAHCWKARLVRDLDAERLRLAASRNERSAQLVSALAAVESLRAKLREAELDAGRAVELLRELVACKDLKDRIDAFTLGQMKDHPPPVFAGEQGKHLDRIAEYNTRKPLAWQRAREFLARPSRAPKPAPEQRGADDRPDEGDPAMWCENVKYLLDSYPGSIRSHQGGGVENLIESLCITFVKLRDRMPVPPEPRT